MTHPSKRNDIRILAIDPATKCGWATDTASGTWDLSVRRDESSGMRLIRFEAKINEIVATGINVIAFEVPSVASGKRANTDGLKLGTKLQAIIERTAEITEGLEAVGYNLAQIKRHATGKGNANKEAMVKAAEEKLGVAVGDDNEADALWILDLAKRELMA